MTESAKTGSNARRLWTGAAALLLAAGVATAGYWAVRDLRCATCGQGGEETQDVPPYFVQAPAAFAQWPRPLTALILSAQMHGYVDPCGCSDPQYGGLVRRYEFIASLKKKNWDVVGLDLGELSALQGINTQNLLKFDLSVKALGAMNYRAFGIGKQEIVLGLGEGLAQIYDKKHPFPRPLAFSLAQAAPGQLFHDELNVRGYEIIDAKPKLGVISMMGPDFRKEFDQQKWRSNLAELPKALKAFADAGVEIGIILHHEYPQVDPGLTGFARSIAIEKLRKERALECAKFCEDYRQKNKKSFAVPPIQLMMLLTEDSLAPAFLKDLDPALPTKTIELGHKGQYVGLIGIYQEGKSYRLQHENVKMTEEWKPGKGQEDKNPVIGLMETYNQQLKNVNMLAQFPRSRHFNQIPGPKEKGLRAGYVGSARCGDCHPQAFAVWKQTNHAHATETLEDKEKLRRPLGRQFDPECMKCHTTGFTHPGGYNDLVLSLADWPTPPAQPPAGNKVQKHNDALRGVSCESCHGPGSAHVKNPDNKGLYALLNPFAPSSEERKLEAIANKSPAEAKTHQQLLARRMLNMTSLCMTCHNDENDVQWGQPGKETADKWLKLIHRTAGNPAPAAKGGNAPPALELIEGKK